MIDLTNEEIRRYSRHLILPEVGMAGQRRIRNASVLCIGAGGLGSPIALYLAAAGIGRIGIVDFDTVDHSNLQRQIIHADADVGRKVFERGLLYLPDYVINGGGIINVAGEIRALDKGEAFDPAWVEAKLARLMETLGEVLDRSRAEKRPADQVANELAKARISQAAERKAA